MHGYMCGWLHVFLHAWTALCIFACVDDWVYGSLHAWLCAHIGPEWKIFGNHVESWKLLILTIFVHSTMHAVVHTHSHPCSQNCTQLSIHTKMHAAIQTHDHACKYARKCIYGRVDGFVHESSYNSLLCLHRKIHTNHLTYVYHYYCSTSYLLSGLVGAITYSQHEKILYFHGLMIWWTI